MNNAIQPAQKMPLLTAKDIDGKTFDITQRQTELPWKMIVVYRGVHCPLCTKQLNALAKMKSDFSDAGVELAAVSADSQEQLQQHLNDLDVNFPLYTGLTLEQMTDFGLYISEPRNENETNHPFSEPAIFVLNEDNQIQIIDKSNAPFSRPDLNALLSGIKFIRENDYPIRGTFAP
ncbi:AhpC/TSA family protein [Pseudoalteromonas shioyasakiensis]|uniref:peroxiredoxin-like family protein n=1 Tax=Pseudoalteromonas shioyasakiensis TaxID=1190813 RepID=UPI00211879F1|nr:peroxiredoxin-like family protein [Pseudoalteromonas shioyasakiensis]MCQ8877767.1 AhpC/TSA family protein [Pseudoalteromonas shioyasakiensis]